MLGEALKHSIEQNLIAFIYGGGGKAHYFFETEV